MRATGRGGVHGEDSCRPSPWAEKIGAGDMGLISIEGKKKFLN